MKYDADSVNKNDSDRLMTETAVIMVKSDIILFVKVIPLYKFAS
jgi:hypothetical protein